MKAVLRTDAPCVALVARKQRAEAVVQYVREERLTRLCGSAGLDLGMAMPQGIALSILAKIVQRCRHPPLAQLQS